MQQKHSSKYLSKIPESIFSTMSRLAYENNAVNLGQGFPDFDGPDWIKDEAYKAMREGKNQYAPMPGIFSLRKAIRDYQEKFYGLEWDHETEITVTAGATEALFAAITAFIDTGDEAIMFEPFYDSHQANVIINGGTPRYVTLKKPDFSFDADELLSKINDRTKLIIINSPHNPTGKIFSPEEMQIIADAAIEHDLIVISDEVYEFLTFDDNKHIPIANIDGMRNRTITISSTGKTFGMTGWKIGFAIASPELTESIRKVHQFSTYAVNTPAQHSMAAAFGRLEEYLPGFRADYSRKRDILYNALNGTNFRPHLPGGSYFMMADLPEGMFADDEEAALKLVKDHGIATIPPSYFYAESAEGKTMLRLCFAKQDESLYNAIEILKSVF